MPFTAFHMGPGMVVKATISRHFSLVVFGLTQIAIDVEVLWYLGHGDFPLHRFCHTYVGATIIAAVLAVFGKPASQWLKVLWNCIAVKCRNADLTVSVPTTLMASITGAFVGAYSHVLLDSLFHPDLEPWQPWSEGNCLIDVFNPHGVEVWCVLLGLVGLGWYLKREVLSIRN